MASSNEIMRPSGGQVAYFVSDTRHTFSVSLDFNSLRVK